MLQQEGSSLEAGFSWTQSFLFCLFVSVFYVSSLYLLPRPLLALPRDHPRHVKYRLAASSTATAFSVAVAYLLRYKLPEGTNSFLISIGIRFDNLLLSVGVSVLLMTVFYFGPLLVAVINLVTEMKHDINYQGKLLPRKHARSLSSVFADHVLSELASAPTIIHVRNLLVAPVTEEIAFRGLMVPALFSSLLLDASRTPSSSFPICFIAPLFFGVAHLHHLYEKVIMRKEKLSSALAALCLQLAYTSIFGYIACYVFQRTGNIAAPIACHMVCNFMGLPDLSFLRAESYLRPYRYPLLLSHAAGLVVFWLLLDPLTSSPHCLDLSPFWI